MSRFPHSFVLLHVSLLGLVAGLPLAKAIEPPPTLPLLVQLEGQALVPFFLEQKQAGLDGAALGQAVQRQVSRIAAEQDALAKWLEADGARVTRRYSRLVNAMRIRISPESRAALAKQASVKRVERLRVYERLTKTSVPASGQKRCGAREPPASTGRACESR